MTKPLRSQAARDRILKAARRIFGEEGYERTTIRAVAAAAAIHPSMVMRYYGSKDGLFAAAATFDLELPDLSQIPREEIGRTLVRHFLHRWTASSGELPALLRVAVTHEQTRDRLSAIMREQIVPSLGAVSEPGQVRTCAALLATQMLGLALTRYVLGLALVVDLSDDVLIEQVGETVQRYLTGPAG